MTRRSTHYITTTKHTTPHKTHTVGAYPKKTHIINIAQTRQGISGSSGSAGTSAKRGHSHKATNTTTVKRGILTAFYPTTYTADVLLLEAASTYLQQVPIAYHSDGTSAQYGNLCAVLFFDEQNYTDAVILAIFANVNQGAPANTPGRVTFIPQYQLLNAVTITAGNTNNYSVTGGHNVPTGALGIIIGGYFTSPTVGAYVQISAHGANPVVAWGNIALANGSINGSGMVPLRTDGTIDIKANTGDCTITLVIYGYIF